ncbi:MAG: imidazole glycerol phosphate synthase subunit HisH [Herminiimonas sp.]|uniref:imidazole glycerol phosphate synthase subunit HisH n=1 Tax=Herminiimonas sp. TaxID=1926289 RepID=UPI002726EE5D|nr:imidazole glycerol phosphate synthase subunit HisH [Herminiimonas sp.]MDO9419789.1 imidazole glycerol phosphate synthase subunit HisH [Herminiimonas sp.]
MITIVDYGMGNLGSIKNMLKKVGFQCEITSSPDKIMSASKLILPGVGAFDAGMARLNDSGLIPALNEQVLLNKIPVLGICLGMQLMTHSSEEGHLPGLGWVDAKTIRFSFPENSHLKVPHMGWNIVTFPKSSNLINAAEIEERFYFVHSYYVKCENNHDVLMRAKYGHEFDAGFEVGNVMGVQFHPEKSHKFGMRLLRNFAEFC